MTDARFVEFDNVGVIFGKGAERTEALSPTSLSIAQGEFLALVGPSGCGKSTVLSMMAGLTDITDGVIVLDGREVADAGPDRGLVFQAPSLVPWLSAFDNVMLGVARVFPHASAAERRDTVAYYLNRVGLGSAMQKKASDLSNGMKQRVGIARAFALNPKMLLLDEPFGMLDSLTRWDLQEVLMEVWSRSQVTAMMVTHDVDEAILLADRILLMTNGQELEGGGYAPGGMAEEVVNPLPRDRTRAQLHHLDGYYDMRNHIVDFLVSRAKAH